MRTQLTVDTPRHPQHSGWELRLKAGCVCACVGSYSVQLAVSIKTGSALRSGSSCTLWCIDRDPQPGADSTEAGKNRPTLSACCHLGPATIAVTYVATCSSSRLELRFKVRSSPVPWTHPNSVHRTLYPKSSLHLIQAAARDHTPQALGGLLDVQH